MSEIHRFEDILSWQKARELSREIYDCSRSITSDLRWKDQIRAASVSVMANIAEGFERSGSNEFLQALSISKGSVGEVESDLYVALDQSYIPRDRFDSIYGLSEETKRLIAGFMHYLRRSDMRGIKFDRVKPRTRT